MAETTKEELEAMIKEYGSLKRKESKMHSMIMKCMLKVQKALKSGGLDELSSASRELEKLYNTLNEHVTRSEYLLQVITPLLSEYGIDIVFEPDEALLPVGSGAAEDEDEDENEDE